VNYLALIGWSPGGGDELLPVDELARRFSLEAGGHSAGVFDEEKLAWVNRHYLKATDPNELARLAVPFFQQAGTRMNPDEGGIAFLASAMPMASASVDRLNQIPARLAFLFDYAPARTLDDPDLREEFAATDARAVVDALAQALVDAPPLDREKFRAIANDVKTKTGQKGKALFHPIRIALTGRSEGPELDLAVPAIDRGAQLSKSAGLPPILANRDRAAAFITALKRT
jgi:glutamyl/glutaminyl-tRNA synthetase